MGRPGAALPTPRVPMERIFGRFKRAFSVDIVDPDLNIFGDDADEPLRTMDDVAQYIKQKQGCKIVVLCGAGISTDAALGRSSAAAGIPDFRSDNGLYSTLANEPLPYPEAMFTLEYFLRNPQPFMNLLQTLLQKEAKPTLAHYFLRLLAEKGLLQRVYTQNVDALEAATGLDPGYICAGHGSMATAHCAVPECRAPYDIRKFIEAARHGVVVRCACGGPVKPGAVFFGEALPRGFFESALRDLPTCDVLIVMGTSLTVHPFVSLIDRVRPNTPRLLINKNCVGESQDDGRTGFLFEPGSWDVFHQSTCNEGCLRLAELLGLRDELLDMFAAVTGAPPKPMFQ